MRHLVICVAGAFIFAGCATTPIPSAQATPVPSERVLAFQNKSDSLNGALILTRDVGFHGGGCFNAFWINGTLAARFGAGETATFFVEPGEHVLRVGRDPLGKGLCGTDSDRWTQRETTFRNNERKFFRLMLNPSGIIDIQRSE
jgi:hypothetical protein